MSPHARAPEPFPWSALERLSGAEARALGQARRQIASRASVAALAEGCSRLLNHPLELEVVEIWADETLPRAPAHLNVPLTLGEGAPKLVLYVENTLALRLASIVFGQPLAWPDPSRPLSPEIAGAAAAFVALAARQTGAPFRLGQGEPRASVFACVRAVVLLGDAVFDALAAVPLERLPPSPLPFDRHALAALGDLPLSLPLVAAVCGASDDDLAALVPGAAWAPGEALTLRRDEGGGWRGQALLVAPGAEVGLEVRAGEGGLTLGDGRGICSWDTSAEEEAGEGPTLRVLRVEVGRVTMTARAWATLSPGASLPAPKPSAVTLRVGGEAIARGHIARVGGDDVVVIDATGGALRLARRRATLTGFGPWLPRCAPVSVPMTPLATPHAYSAPKRTPRSKSISTGAEPAVSWCRRWLGCRSRATTRPPRPPTEGACCRGARGSGRTRSTVRSTPAAWA